MQSQISRFEIFFQHPIGNIFFLFIQLQQLRSFFLEAIHKLLQKQTLRKLERCSQFSILNQTFGLEKFQDKCPRNNPFLKTRQKNAKLAALFQLFGRLFSSPLTDKPDIVLFSSPLYKQYKFLATWQRATVSYLDPLEHCLYNKCYHVIHLVNTHQLKAKKDKNNYLFTTKIDFFGAQPYEQEPPLKNLYQYYFTLFSL